MVYLAHHQAWRTRRYVVFLAMIVAGAAGNIFDSMFYGLVFEEANPWHVASAVPFGTGYAPFLMGKVVDMFYFPLFHTTWPDWLPFVGGQDYTFFSPVFNFADASISVGVVSLLLFCRKDFEPEESKAEDPEKEADAMEEEKGKTEV